MADDIKRKGLAPKQTKITTDERGRSIWEDPVRSAKFELVTTQELHAILDSDDKQSLRSIEDAVAAGDDGVLVRDAETGTFQIIDDTNLQSLLDEDFGLAAKTRPADVTLDPIDSGDTEDENLSLVSTQALRKIIRLETDDADAPEELDEGGGFDPYNTT